VSTNQMAAYGSDLFADGLPHSKGSLGSNNRGPRPAHPGLCATLRREATRVPARVNSSFGRRSYSVPLFTRKKSAGIETSDLSVSSENNLRNV
jgi:hypothetical protein